MRGNEIRLDDLLRAIDLIIRFTNGRAAADLERDDLLMSALTFQLAVIGEAVTRLSPALKDRHPDVEWRDITAFRNRLVHGYYDIQPAIAWRIATVDVRALRP